MKVKLICEQEYLIEDIINKFIVDKIVIDIKLSTGANKSTWPTVLILYHEDDTFLDSGSFEK